MRHVRSKSHRACPFAGGAAAAARLRLACRNRHFLSSIAPSFSFISLDVPRLFKIVYHVEPRERMRREKVEGSVCLLGYLTFGTFRPLFFLALLLTGVPTSIVAPSGVFDWSSSPPSARGSTAAASRVAALRTLFNCGWRKLMMSGRGVSVHVH
jgi:hypothetical protein